MATPRPRALHTLILAIALLLAGCGSDDGGTLSGAGERDLTAVQLNPLHGFTGMGCQQSANCRLAERTDLLFQLLADSGCPDVVTLQEVWSGSFPLITERLGSACPFTYESVVSNPMLGPDEAMVLSRYPVLTVGRQPLFPGFRKVFHVRIDHPIGRLDVFTTHLGSSSDGGPLPCDLATAPCPADCRARGAIIRRDCQALQMIDYIEATHDLDTPALVTGDFNSDPESFVYRQFVARGWIDVYRAAGNPECDPASGAGCTSGRADEDLSQLESRASNENERIDFIFLIPARNGLRCAARLDSPADRDGDGTATRLFADRPNPFASACGPAPQPICWPSDHTGVELDLNCD
jgi:endonuclease/exonuclease/phosphatase family metal-dependent hydrolase